MTLPKGVKKSVQTRTRVLFEAERLYSAGGYEAMNLQTIAEAIGVSKAALFYHFESKQTLFVAVLETMLERYKQLIDVSIGATAESLPQNSSEVQFLALSLTLSKQPMFDAFRFLRSEQQHLTPEQRDHLQQCCTTQLFHPIKKAFEAVFEDGEFREHHLPEVTNMFLGFCVLVSSMRAMEHGALTVADHKKMFAMFWHGIAPNTLDFSKSSKLRLLT